MPSAQQLSLFPDPPPLALERVDQVPRVWVRRLVLWQDMGSEPFRDIALRRGLNIVWSPSGETSEDDRLPSGHAAGKTLFCRALRHCLGEASFASHEDTAQIRGAFPNGAIGAEVVVDNEVWAVRRALAGGPDLAIRGGDVLTIGDAEDASDFAAYLDGLQATLGEPTRVGQYPEPAAYRPWQYALAWLTRDQECRVDGIGSWRHKDTGSRSPVRSSSAEDRLTVLRLALDVYDVRAHERASKIEGTARSLAAKETALRRVAGERDALVSALAGALGLAEGAVRPPDFGDGKWMVEDYKRRTRELIRARITSLRPSPEVVHVDDALLAARDADLAALESRLASEQSAVEALRAERALHAEQRPELERRLSEAKHPTCPYDGHPLDVEASKVACPLVKLPDAEAARNEWERLKSRVREVGEELAVKEPELAATARALRALQREREQIARRVARRLRSEVLEQAQYDEEMAAAWGAKSLVDRLLDANERAALAARDHAGSAEDLQSLRNEENETRAAEDVVRVSSWFQALVHRVLGNNVRGTVWLDGNGLHAEIDQRSVALNSLTVVLFDLASMLCAAEGRACLPAFLLHDSPREGDLDPSTYRRIFRAVHAMAPQPATAPFQYIITTTSAPPEDMGEVFVRLKLASMPAQQRFYGRDL